MTDAALNFYLCSRWSKMSHFCHRMSLLVIACLSPYLICWSFHAAFHQCRGEERVNAVKSVHYFNFGEPKPTRCSVPRQPVLTSTGFLPSWVRSSSSLADPIISDALWDVRPWLWLLNQKDSSNTHWFITQEQLIILHEIRNWVNINRYFFCFARHFTECVNCNGQITSRMQ